jgi:cytochrome c-type biogenesis protein CcmH
VKYWLAFILALQSAFSCYAAEAMPLADDPVVEQRMLSISEELRCLVCQNETLAASRADLAQDLRRELRTLIKENKTDKEIMDYMVSRYGDFVRYRPAVKPITWLLWFGPFLLLFAAVAVLVRMIRRNQRSVETPQLDAEQREKAKSLLKDTEPRS